jgi:hypothetical protein
VLLDDTRERRLALGKGFHVLSDAALGADHQAIVAA